MNEIELKFEAVAQALSAQRDGAMNRSAMLEGEVAVLQRKLQEVERKLAELKKDWPCDPST